MKAYWYAVSSMFQVQYIQTDLAVNNHLWHSMPYWKRLLRTYFVSKGGEGSIIHKYSYITGIQKKLKSQTIHSFVWNSVQNHTFVGAKNM